VRFGLGGGDFFYGRALTLALSRSTGRGERESGVWRRLAARWVDMRLCNPLLWFHLFYLASRVAAS
jgi:hypothetical protein